MRLALVGDLALGDHPKAVGFGFYSRYRSAPPDSRFLFPDQLRADVVFGNMEFSLGPGEVQDGTVSEMCCRGSSRFIALLTKSGFNVVNVANNHTYQHGDLLFQRTAQDLRAAGIRVCGTPEDFQTPLVVANGERCWFLGWSARPRQGFSVSPPYNEFNLTEVCSRVQSAASAGGLVCVSLHWGEEFVAIPSVEERTIARRIIDSGAALIVGHHPHVLREFEEYNGGLIAYSLGNFVGDMVWNRINRQSGCLVVEASGGKIASWSFHPATVGTDYLPRFLEGRDESLFVERWKAHILECSGRKGSYELLAKREMLLHQLKTVAFVIRKLPRYRGHHLWEMFRDAVADRLPGASRRTVPPQAGHD